MDKPIIQFLPGSFDDWEGTQEELDDFVEELIQMAESGELLENSVRIDLDDLAQEDPDLYDDIINSIGGLENNKKLN